MDLVPSHHWKFWDSVHCGLGVQVCSIPALQDVFVSEHLNRPRLRLCFTSWSDREFPISLPRTCVTDDAKSAIQLLCTLYYVPFYFASVRSKTPVQASICLLPMSCSLLPGSAVVSRIISRTGQYRWALWSGWTINTLGAGLLLLLDTSTPTYAWTIIFLIFGTGNGSLLSAINFSIQTSSGSRNAGRAASMYTFVRSFGMAVGVTVGGNIFENWMARRLRHSGLSEHIASDAEAYIRVLRNLAKTDPTRCAILQAYTHGFHGVFVVLLGASAMGLVISGFIGSYSMTYASGDEFESR